MEQINYKKYELIKSNKEESIKEKKYEIDSMMFFNKLCTNYACWNEICPKINVLCI